jgi:DNA-binding response OmpR family regulator
MLTGATKETDIKAALAAGATGYIGKPYNKQALLASIATLLAAKGV